MHSKASPFVGDLWCGHNPGIDFYSFLEVDLANERTPNLEQTMGNQIRGGYATLESFSETGFDINATSSLTISQETRSGFAKAPGHLFGIIGRYEEDEDDEEDDDWALGNENSSTNSSSEDGSLEQLKVPALVNLENGRILKFLPLY